ncbi:TRAP transporter large permease [Jannaschia seohaensis]|uniref:TRAP transporter large permease protein n=1 Tax=Jannaschia seohaensis TaxID=475081 RepID=A0A2Y9AWJ0_9RHOB|nr:TRAP transporter large permease [Jannaschia seohaensis]PWJ17059.1 tripartite ATP-independent transporter DctM subunit [Jannaschia seohaensis]SSA48396.1 TRAP transporter, DctM subunit [Jannaschia seohaensis]
MILLVVVLLVLFVLSVPIAMALGLAAIPTLIDKNIPMIAIPQVIFESLDSFALMALPLYVLAGRLMQHGGIAGRLVDFAKALVSWVRGGLAAAVVMTSMLFATISGSSAATAAAIGSMLIPEMEKQKYPRPFSAATTASSGELGVIIPPSVAMVIYGVITGISITDLFVAGFLPGLMIGASLMTTAILIAWIMGYGERQPFRLGPWAGEVGRSLWRASLSLFMPVIILGGIFGGIFTATEAAVVAVGYALFLSLVVYRELSLRDLPRIFASAAVTSSVVMIIVAFAAMFAFALHLLRAPQQIGLLLTTVTENPIYFLLLVNIFLLIVGMFMETFAAIVILGPILSPIAVSYGIDPVHFGLIMIVNLAVGMVTPPVGVNLFIACGIARISMEQLMRPLSVFLAVLIANLLIITYVPSISLALLR